MRGLQTFFFQYLWIRRKWSGSTRARRSGRCTPAATTRTPQCCSAPPGSSMSAATSCRFGRNLSLASSFLPSLSHTLSSTVHLIVLVSLSRLPSGNLCACHIVAVFWVSGRLIWTSLIVTLRGCIFRAIIYAGFIQRTVSASISSLWSRFPTWCLRSLNTIPL